MSNHTILVFMDFDHTIVDGNTDVEVETLLNGKELPEEIAAISRENKSWTRYMQELFKFLHKHNTTQEDYVRVLTRMPLVEGMKDLLRHMHESRDCEIAIISDANSFFIQCILQHHDLGHTVTKIITNPAEFDKEGCLQLRAYQNQMTCGRCPPNMCKGAVLDSYVARRMHEGVQFYRTLYIGDGLYDVCPALRLGVNDYVFARVGFRLLRSLEKMPAKDVKANIVAWETANDIRD